MASLTRAWIQILRPGNLGLGLAGTAAGGLGAYGTGVEPAGLGLAMAAAALGMAGANAVNDATDAEIDQVAHPERPVPSGLVTPRQAMAAGLGLMASAVVCAAAANWAAGALALALALLLLGYERALKRQGVAGNVAVSAAVAGLFALGAAGAATGPGVWGRGTVGSALGAGAWSVVGAMALLAFLANAARELYKDLEDAPADAGRRRSLPLRVGGPATRALAGLFLGVAVLLGLLLFLVHAGAGDVYLVLVLPALGLFVAAPLVAEPPHASRAVKIGMAFALAAFLSIGIL